MVSATRPRTPSGGNSPANDKLAAIPEAGKSQPPQASRRSSLGTLLRRSKSGELKVSKKQRAFLQEQELERQKRDIPRSPPKLPALYNGLAPPQLQTFGGDERPDSIAIVSNRAGGYQGRSSMDPKRGPSGIPIPPIPGQNGGNRNGEWVDPYARTESMTHRGRYSYASSAVSTINSPRRVRRRKDPTPFK